jgi:hypothetical protein
MVGVEIGTMVSVITAVVGALVALLGLLGFQNQRAKLAGIRAAFDTVIADLASTDKERQLAGAVLLRRFFDPESELSIRSWRGRGRSPYSGEALSVMAAVLRGMPAGDLQKLLADSLAFAPTLEKADLQRTNLAGAYLSLRHAHGTLEGADFYRADLSGASLKSARADEAVFYQARLRHTVLRDADLRGANFFEADLTGAVFTGAHLHGAIFTNARNVPPELVPFVGADGKYTSPERARHPDGSEPTRGSIFLSLPSQRTPAQEAVCDRLATLLRRRGLEPLTLPRREYPPSDAMSEVYRRLAGCAGIMVFGLRPADARVTARLGATPWTHLEAGMAFACNLPMLIVRESGVETGAFDSAVAGHHTHLFDLTETWSDEDALSSIAPWLAQVGGL